MNKFVLLAVVLWLMGGSIPAAMALEVQGLYEAEVRVVGQGAADRREGARAALSEVLVKVTGDGAAPTGAALAPLVSQAEQIMQQFQYRSLPGRSRRAGAETAGQLLWVRFDKRVIDRRLYEAGLPVWGRNRPATVVWLAVEERGRRLMVGGDQRRDLQAVVMNEGQRRGLPIIVPLWDLQDQAALRVVDVWGNFAEPVRKASERYESEAVLLGRVNAVATRWQAHWTLYQGGTGLSWDSAGASPAQAIAAGVSGAADELAQRFAIASAPGVEDVISLAVAGVETLDGYARVTRYLQALDAVSDVQVEQLIGDAVVYRIRVRGHPQALRQTLALGRVLTALPELDDPVWQYRLLR